MGQNEMVVSNSRKIFGAGAIFFALAMFLPTNARASTIYWSENFNGVTALNQVARYFIAYGGAMLSSNEGISNSKCMKMVYGGAGADGALAFNTAADPRGVWYSFDAKVNCGSGSCTGGSKFFKLFQDGGSNMTFRLQYESGNMDYVATGMSTQVGGDDNQQLYYDGSHSAAGVDMHTSAVAYNGNLSMHKDGQWHHYDYYVRYNTDNNADGEVQVWVDGSRKLWATGIANRPNGASIGPENFGLGGYSSASQWTTSYTLYFDNVMATDYRVSAGAGISDFSFSDFLQLLADWLTSNSASDKNSDGSVNTRDLGIMMSGWE